MKKKRILGLIMMFMTVVVVAGATFSKEFEYMAQFIGSAIFFAMVFVAGLHLSLEWPSNPNEIE